MGRARLPEDEAIAIMRAAGAEPLEPYRSVHHKWRCRCTKCGNEITPRVAFVEAGVGVCPGCATSGYDPLKLSLLYLLSLEDDGLLKIGVMNDDSPHLRIHRRRGWEPILTWPLSGERALIVEAWILDWWRDQDAVFATRDQVPAGDGFTETVIAASVNIADTIERIEDLVLDSE